MKPSVNLTNVYGTKSITLDQYPPEAWDFLEGDADGIDKASVKLLSESVPWLFRGINLIVEGVSTVPIALTRGKVDAGYLGGEINSPLSYTEDLPTLIRRICASLILEGCGYLFRDKAEKINATKKLWYWNPLSVTFDAKKTVENKKISFKRKNGSRYELYDSDRVIYFWLEDAYVEIGPPETSPAKAALSSAGVLYNVDQYVAAYFKRGAIKAMMLSVKGAPNQDQKEELKKWWKDLTGGIKKAFNIFTVNADSVTPTVIGDGLDGLHDSTLTTEMRENISTALGIPQTILFSTAARGIGGSGVMDEDTTRFYQQTIVPLIKFICDVLNKQQFKDSGYLLDVREEEMDIFQEDEEQRSIAVSTLTNALEMPENFKLAASILGYDLTEEEIVELDKLIAKREEAAKEIQQQTEQKPVEEKPEEDVPPQKTDLQRLRRKALKNVGKDFSFESDEIPNLPELMERIKTCQTEEEVKLVFDAPVSDKPVSAPDLSVLLETAIKAMQTEPSVSVTVHNHPSEPPVVNVETTPAVVNVEPTPIEVKNEITVQPKIEKNEPDESKDVVKAIRKLARGK